VTTLIDKIENRTAVIGIVGLGYVGLPLAVVFSEAGFRVKGIDVDARRVDAVNRCESYIEGDTKIGRLIGWRPVVSLTETLAQVIEYEKNERIQNGRSAG